MGIKKEAFFSGCLIFSLIIKHFCYKRQKDGSILRQTPSSPFWLK